MDTREDKRACHSQLWMMGSNEARNMQEQQGKPEGQRDLKWSGSQW